MNEVGLYVSCLEWPLQTYDGGGDAVGVPHSKNSFFHFSNHLNLGAYHIPGQCLHSGDHSLRSFRITGSSRLGLALPQYPSRPHRASTGRHQWTSVRLGYIPRPGVRKGVCVPLTSPVCIMVDLRMLRHNGQRLFSLEKPFDDDRALSLCSTRWDERMSLAAVAMGEGGSQPMETEHGHWQGHRRTRGEWQRAAAGVDMGESNVEKEYVLFLPLFLPLGLHRELRATRRLNRGRKLGTCCGDFTV